MPKGARLLIHMGVRLYPSPPHTVFLIRAEPCVWQRGWTTFAPFVLNVLNVLVMFVGLVLGFPKFLSDSFDDHSVTVCGKLSVCLCQCSRSVQGAGSLRCQGLM